MNVYELDADANRYENLYFPNEEVVALLLDAFDRRPLAETWVPYEVKVLRDRAHRGRPPSDYPSLHGTMPVFSARAVEALRDLLEPNGEILPLTCPDGEYYAYNVLTVLDAFDEEHSECRRFTSGDIMHVAQYAFFGEPLVGATIFKLTRLRRSRNMVTDAFVKRVTGAGLTGFWFVPLWSESAPE